MEGKQTRHRISTSRPRFSASVGLWVRARALLASASPSEKWQKLGSSEFISCVCVCVVVKFLFKIGSRANPKYKIMKAKPCRFRQEERSQPSPSPLPWGPLRCLCGFLGSSKCGAIPIGCVANMVVDTQHHQQPPPFAVPSALQRM